MLSNNFSAAVITFVVALVWLRANNLTAARGWIGAQLSRKIIHIGTGVFFVLCWLLFPGYPSARYFAAAVPAVFTLQFLLVGTGIIQDKATVQSVSRTGDRRELLKGPLIYGLVFIAITILFWTDSPAGIVALMMLCGGDGFADILGSRFGHSRLPWNPKKSWAGSLGMFTGGFLFSIFVLAPFIWRNHFHSPIVDYLLPLALISGAATMVESLPIQDLDNLTITLTAIILGNLLF